jgi:hypothetical protein
LSHHHQGKITSATFSKAGHRAALLGKSPFEKGGFRGICQTYFCGKAGGASKGPKSRLALVRHGPPGRPPAASLFHYQARAFTDLDHLCERSLKVLKNKGRDLLAKWPHSPGGTLFAPFSCQ